MIDREVIRQVADDLKEKYRPVEGKPDQSTGQLGFDYGYQQAIVEMESRLLLVLAKREARSSRPDPTGTNPAYALARHRAAEGAQ